jgi:hypothetical protein
MKKLILSISIAASILYIGLSLLDSYYTKVILRNNCEKNFWIIKKENKKLDYVVLGSSRAESQINIKVLNKITNKKGLNIGRNGVGLAENYLILHHFLKQNSTKQIILQVDPFCFNPNKSLAYPFNDYLFMPYLDDSTTSNVVLDKAGYLKHFFWKHIPFIRYAEFNSEYKFFSIINDYGVNCNVKFDKYGYLPPSKFSHNAKFIDGVLIDQRYNNGTLNTNEIPLKIDPLRYFHKIKISIFMAPIHPKWKNLDTDFSHFCNKIDSLTSSINLPYYNYNTWTMNEPDKYYSDFTHLNSEGINLFMEKFSEISINQ